MPACMLLWPAQSHTSPTNTSSSFTVFFPPTVRARPSALASSGASLTAQLPSASAVTVFD